MDKDIKSLPEKSTSSIDFGDDYPWKPAADSGCKCMFCIEHRKSTADKREDPADA